MALQHFSLGEVGKVDAGRVVEAFDAHVRKAIADCDDRPGNKRPRVVALKLSLVPRVREQGEAYEVSFAFAVEAKIPTTQSPEYFGAIRKSTDGPGFVFEDLTGDPQQLGLDEGTTAFD